jgi:hypothetical protein
MIAIIPLESVSRVVSKWLQIENDWKQLFLSSEKLTKKEIKWTRMLRADWSRTWFVNQLFSERNIPNHTSESLIEIESVWQPRSRKEGPRRSWKQRAYPLMRIVVDFRIVRKDDFGIIKALESRSHPRMFSTNVMAACSLFRTQSTSFV